MNKKYAWTLAELMMALIFIMVIAGFLISNFKPSQQNAKIKAYAGIRNIEKGIVSVGDYYTKAAATKAREHNDSNNNVITTGAVKRTIFYKNAAIESAGNDTFCMILADAFSLKEAPNCSNKNIDLATPNFVFPNGMEIYGLSSEPFTFFTKANIGESFQDDTNFESVAAYKNIMIDVDGAKGKNRIGVDRFPLRIYSLDNVVFPVNCNESAFFDWRYENTTGKATPSLSSAQKNPYCKGGKNFDGAQSKQNFWLDNEMITFDTFRNTIIKREGDTANNKSNIEQNNESIAFTRNAAETICGVFGGTRFLSVAQCTAYGYRIFDKCPSKESCLTCSTGGNVCPKNGSNVTTQGENGTCISLYNSLNNKQNFCYYGLHRPSAGMSAIVSGIMGGELDME